MTFAHPLGLLGLVAIPVVLALHLFRRRHGERRVAGLFLWAAAGMTTSAGRKPARLIRSASLWFELAAALLLALWLAGLSFGVTHERRHVVVVVDDTASMGARGLPERARAFVASLADDLPAGAVATVIKTGRRPEVLLGPRAPAGLLQSALAGWMPRQPGHDPGPALALGLELGQRDLVYVTDRVVPVPEAYRLHAVGVAADNAAVVAARRVTSAGRDRLFVDVAAFSGTGIETRIRVFAGRSSTPVAEARARLTPGASRSIDFALPESSDAIRIELDDDALTVDNTCTLLHEPERRIKAASLLGEVPTELAELGRVLGAIGGVDIARDPAAADLVFASSPGRLRPGCTEVVVGVAGGTSDAWLGPFLIERRHPVLDGVTLGGVIWTAGRAALPGRPLVSAGEQVLISEEAEAGARRLRINIDLARSNVTTAPDWPILVANITRQVRRSLAGPGPRNVRLGDPIRYRFIGSDAALAAIALVSPSDARLPARGLHDLSWPTHEPGRHRLELPGGEHVDYAVQFVDSHESDLRRAETRDVAAGVAAPQAPRARAGASGETEGRWLAFLLLLLVAADWCVLHRRRAA